MFNNYWASNFVLKFFWRLPEVLPWNYFLILKKRSFDLGHNFNCWSKNQFLAKLQCLWQSSFRSSEPKLWLFLWYWLLPIYWLFKLTYILREVNVFEKQKHFKLAEIQAQDFLFNSLDLPGGKFFIPSSSYYFSYIMAFCQFFLQYLMP